MRVRVRVCVCVCVRMHVHARVCMLPHQLLWSGAELGDVEALKQFLQSSEHSVVGFFTDSSSKLAKSFKTMADGLRESFRFAHTTAEAVLTEFGYSE